MKTLIMNLNNINQLDKIDFISYFGNIFEESKFITEIAETKRPVSYTHLTLPTKNEV